MAAGFRLAVRRSKLKARSSAPSAMEHPLTIGICGSGPGAGKDTVADLVCAALSERGVRPRRERFATPLRECVAILTGVSVAESRTTAGKGRHLPAWGMTVGQMLQRLGTEAVRGQLHEDAWVLSLFQRLGAEDVVVISDVRFPNEVAAIRARRGVVLRVERPAPAVEAAGAEAILAGRDPNHASERALDGVEADIVIANDGGLEELASATRAAVADLFGGA
jgi:hypothetical protein